MPFLRYSTLPGILEEILNKSGPVIYYLLEETRSYYMLLHFSLFVSAVETPAVIPLEHLQAMEMLPKQKQI